MSGWRTYPLEDFPGLRTRYDPSNYPPYKPEFDDFAMKFAERGATDRELADLFGIPVGLLYEWRNLHEGFARSIKVGKEVADERVKRALYQMAVGFEVEDERMLVDKETGEPIYVPYVRKVDPQLGAATMWLKNRCRDEFRDKVDHGIEGANGGAVETITRIEIVGVEPKP